MQQRAGKKKEICCWYGSLYAIPWQSDKCKCLCEQHKLFPLLKNVWLGSRFCSLKHFISFSLTFYCGKISCAIIGGIILGGFFSKESFFDKLYWVVQDRWNTDETKSTSHYHWSVVYDALIWLADGRLALVYPANGDFTRMHILSLVQGTAIQLTSITCNYLLTHFVCSQSRSHAALALQVHFWFC